jgi:hypothetical protein
MAWTGQVIVGKMIATLWRHSRALWVRPQWRGLILGGTIAASVALLLLGVIRGWPELARYQWKFDWLQLALSSLMYAGALALVLLPWIVIMRALGAGSFWRQDVKFCLYSLIARRLPTPAPYIASRILLYEEIGVPKRITSVGLLWENLLIIAAGAILVLLILPFTPIVNDRMSMAPILLAAGLGLLLVARPMAPARAANWLLQRMGKEPLAVLIHPPAMALALTLYVGGWLLGGLILFFLIRAIYPIGWETLPMVMQGWVFSGLASYIVFFAPFGFGIREFTLGALLLLVVPLPVAVVIVLLSRLWVMGNELLWALIFYRF